VAILEDRNKRRGFQYGKTNLFVATNIFLDASKEESELAPDVSSSALGPSRPV
jgi:hypothetical protein